MDSQFDALVAGMTNELSVTGNGAESDPEVVRALAWTEYAFGRGYALLRMRPAALSAVSVYDESPTIDASGKPIHAFLPLIISGAKSVASPASDGCLKVSVSGGVGGWIAPYIAYSLAQRRFHTAVFWRPAAGSVDEAPPTLIMAASAIDGEVPPILIAPGEAYGAKSREKILVGQVPAQLIEGLHYELDRSPEGSFLTVVTVPDRMDSHFTDFISIGDALDSFALANKPPELLDFDNFPRNDSTPVALTS